MKRITNYIKEALYIKHNTKTAFLPKLANKFPFENNVNCKALSKEYIQAIIAAYMKSSLYKKINVQKAYVTNAIDFFKNEGKSLFNIINSTYLYNRQYPVIVFEIGESKRHIRRETFIESIPHIPMELVLSDSKGLYHKHNTRNISGNCDVESIAIGPWYIRDYDTGVMKTYIAALYYVKPNANIKLLPVDDVYNNLLEYYKLGIEKRRVKIRELDIDFYSDRDLKPNDEEENNRKTSWEDNEQAELWKVQAVELDKLYKVIGKP
jgi:hypothetical protein